mgnify:CR=1 FL=1
MSTPATRMNFAQAMVAAIAAAACSAAVAHGAAAVVSTTDSLNEVQAEQAAEGSTLTDHAVIAPTEAMHEMEPADSKASEPKVDTEALSTGMPPAAKKL